MGLDRRPAFRTAATSTSSARIRSGAGCSTPEPRRESSSPSTRATTGNRSRRTCRIARCATSPCAAGRSRRRHPRPLVLGARRPHSPAAAGREGRRRPGLAVRAANGDPPESGSRSKGTPELKDEPKAANPPRGAILDYVLKSSSPSPVVIEILDQAGASRPALRERREGRGARPAEDPRDSGLDRRRATSPRPRRGCTASSGIFGTVRRRGCRAHGARNPSRGVWAPPGRYQVRLVANGQTVTRPLVVAKDPRISSTDDDLLREFQLAKQVEAERVRLATALDRRSRPSRTSHRPSHEGDGSGAGGARRVPQRPRSRRRAAGRFRRGIRRERSRDDEPPAPVVGNGAVSAVLSRARTPLRRLTPWRDSTPSRGRRERTLALEGVPGHRTPHSQQCPRSHWSAAPGLLRLTLPNSIRT